MVFPAVMRLLQWRTHRSNRSLSIHNRSDRYDSRVPPATVDELDPVLHRRPVRVDTPIRQEQREYEDNESFEKRTDRKVS